MLVRNKVFKVFFLNGSFQRLIVHPILNQDLYRAREGMLSSKKEKHVMGQCGTWYSITPHPCFCPSRQILKRNMFEA